MKTVVLWFAMAVLLSVPVWVGCSIATETQFKTSQETRAPRLSKPFRIADLDPFMVVQIHSPGGGGTCFPIKKLEDGNFVFMTASHVVKRKPPGARGLKGEPFTPEELHLRAGARTIKVVRVESHDSLDVALVWTSGITVSDAFELRTEVLAFGEGVRTIGWFLGNSLIVTEGNVGLASISAPFYFGMSGGPLLDENNKVVGVITGISFSDDTWGVHPLMIANEYTAIAEILDWLRLNEVVD